MVQEYFKLGKPATDAQGWFTTGGEWAECSTGERARGRTNATLQTHTTVGSELGSGGGVDF